MTEVQYMREIENLEEQNRKLKESLTACKLEVNKLRAALREIAEDTGGYDDNMTENEARQYFYSELFLIHEKARAREDAVHD